MSRTPESSCCRSSPRCRDCPVLRALAARARAGRGGRAALVEEILGGAGAPLPEPVADALAALERARLGRAAAVL